MIAKKATLGASKLLVAHAAIPIVLVAIITTIIALNIEISNVLDYQAIEGRPLLIVSDDRAAWEVPGCDAVSIVDNTTGLLRHVGATMVSPGRLAASADLSLIFAGRSNGILLDPDQRFRQPDVLYDLYVLRSDMSSPTGWRDTYLDSPIPVLGGGGIVITRDSRYLVVATQERDANCGSSSRKPNKYSVTKFDIETIDWQAHRLGPPISTFDTKLPAGEILLDQDGSTIHLITARDSTLDQQGTATLHSLDIESFDEIAPPIVLAEIAPVPVTVCSRAYIHAALSPDGRFIITSRWSDPSINVIDLETRSTWALPVEGLDRSAGLAFSYGATNHGLLAVHGIQRFATYKWTFDGRALELLSVVELGGEHKDYQLEARGPYGSLAWVNDGSQLAISIPDESSPFEFGVWDILDNGRTLQWLHEIRICSDPNNMPNDVISTDELLPLPTTTSTATSTPIPTTAPSSTLTSTPSATLTITPSRTPTSTATATPSSTATRRPIPVYLPLLLREKCLPEQQRMDVVLIIDASLSMLERSAANRTKLEAAQAAAMLFLGRMQLGIGDQGAVIAFNSEAIVLQALTQDRTALGEALSRITAAPQTCIVCGVDAARAELGSQRRRAGNRGVMIVLTDGRSNPQPVSEAVAAAAMAKTAGAAVFTIGLGEDVDAEALAAMASKPEWYYPAPDAEALEEIYEAIAVAIPCPTDAFWGGR